MNDNCKSLVKATQKTNTNITQRLNSIEKVKIHQFHTFDGRQQWQ